MTPLKNEVVPHLPKPIRCTRSWWRGGHCWHHLREEIIQLVCRASGCRDGTSARDRYVCCLCQQEMHLYRATGEY